MNTNTKQAAFRSPRGQELYSLGKRIAGNPAPVLKGRIKQLTDRAIAELWDTATFVAKVQGILNR